MRRIRNCLVAVIVLLWSTSAFAQWIENGIPICTEIGSQEQPRIVNDGSGGAIIIWVDSRNDDGDIYAQRISGDGNILWPYGGIAVCTAEHKQWYPEAVADGAGGVIITWQDFRLGCTNYDRYNHNIYAQKINGDGSLAWIYNGLPVCARRGDQERPVLVSDGSGGAIIAWRDPRSGYGAIYAQRIRTSGMPVWQGNGIPVCDGGGERWVMYREWPDISSDGSGGAIITWKDYRNGNDYDIFAQRILATGTPSWIKNGIPVCANALPQLEPHIVHDETGGAIITWIDANPGSWNISSQRVSADGSILWQENGETVCTVTRNPWTARLVPDGAGGSIIAWRGTGGIYTQKISGDGSVEWPMQGVPVSLYSRAPYGIPFISDNAGGAIFAGYRYFIGTTEVHAQRISMNGLTEWMPDGIPICTERSLRQDVRIVFDGSDGAITVWEDFRNGEEGDIYAMRVYGEIPPIDVHLDIRPGSCPNPLNPKSKGVLPVAIAGTDDLDVTGISASSIELEGVPPLRWKIEDVTAPVSSEEECACTEAGPDGIPDLIMKFSVSELVNNIGTVIAGQVVKLTATGTLLDDREIKGTDCVIIRGEMPRARKENRERLIATLDSKPNDPIQQISYYLPGRSDVQAAVYDVSGRLVKRFENVYRETGINTLEWDTSGLPSGMYFCRIASGSYIETKKIVLLR